MLWTRSIYVVRSYVLAGDGESFCTLIIAGCIYTDSPGGAELLDDFARTCTNLKSLSIPEKEPDWISRFRKQLEAAEVACSTPVDFPMECNSLREVTIYSSTFTDSCADLLEDIGSNLESLTANERCIGRIESAYIKEHCPNLKRISIRAARKEYPSLVTLLSTYGSQLLLVYLYGINEEKVRRVANAGPKARFQSENIFGSELSMGSLNLLGPRLESIKINKLAVGNGAIGWESTWDKCINLRELCLDRCDFDLMEAIMATPKEHLRILEVDVFLFLSKAIRRRLWICVRSERIILRSLYLLEMTSSAPHWRSFLKRTKLL